MRDTAMRMFLIPCHQFFNLFSRSNSLFIGDRTHRDPKVKITVMASLCARRNWRRQTTKWGSDQVMPSITRPQDAMAMVYGFRLKQNSLFSMGTAQL